MEPHFQVKKGEVGLGCRYVAFRSHNIGENEVSRSWFRRVDQRQIHYLNFHCHRMSGDRGRKGLGVLVP